MNTRSDLERRIGVIAALDQPQRRDLYRLLRRSGRWLSRDEAAEALGVPRSVAAFHLDKLAEAGLVEVRFERTGGRSGPGAGRPSKIYRTSDAEVTASIPDRHYDLAGSLMAAAIAQSTRTGASAAQCLSDLARHAGARIGHDASGATVVEVLAAHGYEPRVDSSKQIVLANCPFHRLADEQRDLVCHMNFDFLEGVLTGLGATGLRARLDPAPGRCCVGIEGD